MQRKLKIKEVAYHRNGICGEPFNAVHFMDGNREMLGIVFDESAYCAVVQLNQPQGFTVQFGINSWRGDHYEDELRKAIKTHQSSGSNRLGPFAIPTGKSCKS